VEPIVILAMPRSGSSMTAGIFAKHGVWVGPYQAGDKTNARGHFECLPIKREIVKAAGKLVEAGTLARPVDGWRHRVEAIIAAHGYNCGPWMVKHSAMYYPLWHEFNSRFVCVRRSVAAVKESGKRTGYLTNPEAIPAHTKAMDHVRDHLGGVDVFTDELVAGNYSSLERAFDNCLIDFDPAIADDFIDPSLWHYR